MDDFVLMSDEPGVTDAVLSAAAAAGVSLGSDPARARCVLASAGEAVAARAGCGDGAELWVVGHDAAAIGAEAMRVRGRVLLLPDGSRLLAELFVGTRRARFVTVVGGSGGVGASTLAAALALAAVEEGRTAALVESDPRGGGVDLLLGAERAAGWRWSSLVGARGELGDLRAHLPASGGVTFVGLDRAQREAPSAAALQAVLDALGRSHDVVVCDAGRADEGMDAGAGPTVVVAGNRVGAVSAASGVVEPERVLVVREQPAGSLSPVEVGEALGLHVAGVVPTDRRVGEGAEQGVDPWRAGRRGFRRAVRELLHQVAGDGDGRR